MDKKISIVIPTLQKRIDVLENLVKTLNNDDSIGEIIIINNLPEKSLDFDYDKLKIITPNRNVYVNPAWNMGVDFAEYEIIGLLNDDIIIADDFCTSLIQKLPEKFGVIGYSKNDVIPVEDIENNPKTEEIKLNKKDFIDSCFGIAMFFKKSLYSVIPSEMKIMYGDCWIFDYFKKQGFINYEITNQKIYHFGSLTSSSKNFNPVIENDKKVYKKLTIKWYQKIFSIKEYADCVKMRFLGANIRLYNKKEK